MDAQVEARGWFWLHRAPKRHYFITTDGKLFSSLCGTLVAPQWVGDELRPRFPASVNNCKTCQRKSKQLQSNG